MLNYYRLATLLLSPLVPYWLMLRARRGKEEPGRLRERFGETSYGRPKGKLLWIHAASVGEANSVISLVQQLRQRFPTLNILLTTGTVTSAMLMKKRLPPGVIHHYAPVDTPEATERFIRHWLPDIVWFVESELWPNLIDAAARYYCLMALINARMSERSFYFWQKYQHAARSLLGHFSLCCAQSEEDAIRLRTLGAQEVLVSGNLKYDAPALPCHEAELLVFKNALAGRRIWLAASTHPGEEALIAAAHRQMAASMPDLLTIIAPRHPDRGAAIAAEIAAFGPVAQRSRSQEINASTAFYIADTLGELGLFYRVCEVVFMGGSLVPHGGQNPLEPALLSCALVCGPHYHNFTAIYRDLQACGAIEMIANDRALATAISGLLQNGDRRYGLQQAAVQFMKQKGGGSDTILDLFAPVFAL